MFKKIINDNGALVPRTRPMGLCAVSAASIPRPTYDLSFLNAQGQQYIDALWNSLVSIQAEAENAQLVYQETVQLLRTTGYLPQILYRFIHLTDGSWDHIVISQGLTQKQEDLLLKFIRPAASSLSASEQRLFGQKLLPGLETESLQNIPVPPDFALPLIADVYRLAWHYSHGNKALTVNCTMAFGQAFFTAVSTTPCFALADDSLAARLHAERNILKLLQDELQVNPSGVKAWILRQSAENELELKPKAPALPPASFVAETAPAGPTALTLTISAKRLLKTFELVNVPGISGHEAGVRNVVRRMLTEMDKNFSFRIDEKGNLFAELTGQGLPGKTLFFTTHLDVYGPLGTPERLGLERIVVKESTQEKTEKRDLVLGADSRAGISAILEVAQKLREEPWLYNKLVLLFTVEEEIGFRGVRAADLEQYRAEVPFIFSADVPIRTYQENSGYMLSYQLPEDPADPLLGLIAQVAREMGLPEIYNNGFGPNPHIGGDASILARRGWKVFDLCLGTKHQHTMQETLLLKPFFAQTELLYRFSRRFLQLSNEELMAFSTELPELEPNVYAGAKGLKKD